MFARKTFGLLTIFVLSSCGKEAKDEETGVDSTSGETAETDSGDPVAEGTPLVVEFDADALGALSTFALTWMDLDSLESETVLFAEKNTQGSVVDQQQIFMLRDPLEEEMQVVDSDSGLAVAAYVGSVQWEDTGAAAYFGVAEQWVIYSNMEVVSVGINEGWNFFSPATETFSSFSNLAMPSNLNPVDVLSIGGSYAQSAAVSRRLVLLPTSPEWKALGLKMVWDSTIEPQWTCDLVDAPPEDHFYLNADKTFLIAGEIPFSYADLDENGEYDEGQDSLEFGACVGDVAVAAMFFTSPDELATALGFQVAGIRPGWMLMRLWTPEGVSPFVEPGDYLTLQIGKNCLLAEPEPTGK